MKQRVNAYDVARLAKVSQSTVSRVLNNYPHVKKVTREKVHKAIEELGFSPDEIARSLANKKTNTIGLIVEDLSNPFYAETAHIILKEAYKSNYEVIILDAISDTASFDRAFNTLIGKRVDGIIVSSVHKNNELIKKMHQSSLPIIFYNRIIDNANKHNYITIDNKLGAKKAVDYLVELGHKNIAYISGPMIYSTFEDRYNGFVDSLEENGITVNENFIYRKELVYDKILDFAIKLMEKDDRPTAFFASTDQLALIIMEAVSRVNLRIPEDVSIVGFDDINISSNPFINLTTVSQQKEVMAAMALNSIIEIINSQNDATEKKQVILDPILIKRGTTSDFIKGSD